MSSKAQAAKVKEHWGDGESAQWRTSQRLHWTEHPKVQERLNFLVSGDRGQDRFQYFIQKYFRRNPSASTQVERIITLGCGHGEFERGLAPYHFAKIHEAVDLADGAIEQAKKLAEADGLKHVRYSVADLNSIKLSRCAYDVVFGISSIHHVSNLEHLFREVALALKPDGYFFLDEFIGPTKFQWTDEQLNAINQNAAALPPKLRRSLIDGSLKGEIGRISIQEMDEVDPSEAVRSADILKVLPLYFDIVEFKGCGGSLLHLVLEGIAGNFSPGDPDAMTCLESLFRIEDELIASGTLRHDFAVIIARPKPAWMARLLWPKAAGLFQRPE